MSKKTELRAAEKARNENDAKIAKAALVDSPTDEQRKELKELLETRSKIADQVVSLAAELELEEKAEANNNPEKREFSELQSKVKLANYVEAAMEMRAVRGSELELNQEMKLPAGHFPLELLALSADELPTEERASTGIDTAVRPTRWMDRLFYGSAASRLGITFEGVSPGVTAYPIITGGASAAQRGKGEAVADGAWTVGTSELKPTRNGVSISFSKEDTFRLPGLEDALTRDLRMALMDGIDKAVFLGDDGATGNDADIAGLNTAGIVEKTITQANKVKGAETLTAFAELADGLHAESIGDLRIVTSVGANVLWLTTVINAAADNQTLAQFLRASGLMWTVRGDIDTATSNGKFGGFIGRGRGLRGAAVAPIWNSGELIRDPYTGAKKGEVTLTLSYFWNFGLVRATNFARLKFVT